MPLTPNAIQIRLNQGSWLITGGCADHCEKSFLDQILRPLGVIQPLPEASKAARDPPWNSSIKASSLVIVGALAQSFRRVSHILHASLMSQDSQKFPLRSILLVFLLNFINTTRVRNRALSVVLIN